MSPFEYLCNEPERINPAILMAEELMRKNLAEILDFDDLARAENALSASKYEIAAVRRSFDALVRTPEAASDRVPAGF